jgi:hypothetical protein
MLCWSFVNLSPMLGIYELLYAMYMSQLYLCVKKCGRNGKKFVSRPVALARVVRQPSQNTVQMTVVLGKVA